MGPLLVVRMEWLGTSTVGRLAVKLATNWVGKMAAMLGLLACSMVDQLVFQMAVRLAVKSAWKV